MIKSVWFYDLLDCLAGQFFENGNAQCVGNEFGIHLSLAAKDYFSVAIIQEELPDNKAVLGVLIDDSAHDPSRNGYTLVIFIDTRKITGEIYEILFLLILAHEVCHFVFYYELFIKLGDNTGIVTHSNFTHIVAIKLIEAIIEEQDSTSQTIMDEHDIDSLARNYRNFPKKHFTKGKDSNIDYKHLLDDFFNYLHIGEKINEYRRNNP